MEAITIFILPALGLVIYILLLQWISTSLHTRHSAFWWMFFLTIPLGVIITLLLDIKDNTYPMYEVDSTDDPTQYDHLH